MKLYRPSIDNTVVIGIDPASTRLAVVAWYRNEFTYIAASMKHLVSSGPEACGRVGSFITENLPILLPDEWPDKSIAWVEEPVVGVGMRSTIVVSYTAGAVMAAFAPVCRKIHLVSNSHWKKEVLGKGNATKEEIGEYVQEHWPALYQRAQEDKRVIKKDKQDILDAAAICEHGIRKLGFQRSGSPTPHRSLSAQENH